MTSNYWLHTVDVEAIVDQFMVDFIRPRMEREGVYKRPHLAVVVAFKGPHDFDDSVVYEHRFVYGGPAEFEHPYHEIAHKKCELSWTYEMSTREISEIYPTLMLEGDVVHPGGVFLYGIAVGVSGIDNWDDEAIAAQIAVEIWRHVMAAHVAFRKAGNDFLPRLKDD